MARTAMPAIVLAGERPGGNALARARGLAASVLIKLGPRSCFERVIAALRECTSVNGGIVVGPDGKLHQEDANLRQIFAAGDFSWLAPDRGPSASALKAAKQSADLPVLITAADHGLLTAQIVDDFCHAALATDADFVVGLVPYVEVKAAYPDSKRTRLRFSDGQFCGANLFMLKHQSGFAALEFWQRLEHDRKRPWKIAGRIGLKTLWRYLLGALSVAQAFELLSKEAGTRVALVKIHHARAAIDVDSEADLQLALEILGEKHAERV